MKGGMVEMTRERGRMGRHTTIIFAVITNHEHNLPFKDIVIHQSARYSGEILRGLHVLQLSCEKARCTCRGLCHVRSLVRVQRESGAQNGAP
jgi:hypothetical protein